ncbi:MAG TPA: BrnT family toxin [Candidatus Saccharimonadales bacterium]|nr:BrnT family toxin [Candidatus Saccharimonadales bacterium]
MIDLGKIVGFEWDKWNLDKNYIKHGITPKEAEEVFLDENVLLIEDIKHSGAEERSIAIGMTVGDSLLFVVFTVRSNKIRIISARIANKKERRQYEQA